MLGAWRNKRWIVYAAEQCAGWIASGLYPKPEELEAGIKFYRDAGGKRAVLSNVIIDLHGNAADMPLGGKAPVMLTGGEAAARDRLQMDPGCRLRRRPVHGDAGIARRPGPAARRGGLMHWSAGVSPACRPDAGAPSDIDAAADAPLT